MCVCAVLVWYKQCFCSGGRNVHPIDKSFAQKEKKKKLEGTFFFSFLCEMSLCEMSKNTLHMSENKNCRKGWLCIETLVPPCDFKRYCADDSAFPFNNPFNSSNRTKFRARTFFAVVQDVVVFLLSAFIYK